MKAVNLTSLARTILVADLVDTPDPCHIEVSSEDLAKLAQAYDVEDAAMLRADVEVSRHGSLIRVAGSLEADLGRICVVSLESMRELIAEDFAVQYTMNSLPEAEGELEADLDAPEPLGGDVLDLGDVVLEQLVLAMDPHPKKEGASPPIDPGAGQESSPFDVLKQLKS